MEAYCMKCKTKREMKDPVAEFNAKGTARELSNLPGLWNEALSNGKNTAQ